MSVVAVIPAAPRLRLASGSIEALKWLALLCMVVDHVNAVMYSRELGPWATAIGRIAFPLFAVCLGVNLARPGADKRECLMRLLVVGAVATIPHALLFGYVGPWPLNVLCTFAVAVAWLLAVESGRTWLLPMLAGLCVLVEYWWPGVALVVLAHALARHGATPHRVMATMVALLLLCLVNTNAWALLAVPVVALVHWWSPHVSRSGRFFWWFYPVHLVALALLVCMARV